VGGQGTPRSYRIAARYADEFNLSSATPAVVVEKFAALDAAARDAGRDPATITHSAMVGVLIGRDEAELAAREAAVAAAFGGDADGFAEWFEVRKARWIHGTPDAAREQVRRFRDAGVTRIMLQDFIPNDLDMIDLAAEVLFDA
jgi:alkanesulfonate monooxygenase SsuD/methylene tetrahydromethanopterin reductase-like flavin-dependent oxidoreductase (luciferase family)